MTTNVAPTRGENHTDQLLPHISNLHPLTSISTSGGPSFQPRLTSDPSAHPRRPSDDPTVITSRLVALADSMYKSRQTYFKRFDNLYILNILQYQYEIAALEKRLRETGAGEKGQREVMGELRGLLGEYNAAIQDAQQILTTRTVPASYSAKILQQQQTSTLPLNAPHPQVPYTHHERLLTLNLGLSTGLLDIMDTVSSTLGDYPYIHSHPLQQHSYVRWWNRLVRWAWDAMITTGWAGRFAFGVVGGAFLVVPMVVMLYREEREAQIAVVGGSILVFVAVMAVVTRGSMQDIFGATAAYAAVLVVFVGVQNGWKRGGGLRVEKGGRLAVGRAGVRKSTLGL